MNNFAFFLLTSTLNGENHYEVGSVVADGTPENPCVPENMTCTSP
jgi:hypothetical protein